MTAPPASTFYNPYPPLGTPTRDMNTLPLDTAPSVPTVNRLPHQNPAPPTTGLLLGGAVGLLLLGAGGTWIVKHPKGQAFWKGLFKKAEATEKNLPETVSKVADTIKIESNADSTIINPNTTEDVSGKPLNSTANDVQPLTEKPRRKLTNLNKWRTSLPLLLLLGVGVQAIKAEMFKGLPVVCEKNGEMVQLSVVKNGLGKHPVASFSGATGLKTCQSWEQTIEAKIPKTATALTIVGFKNSLNQFAVAEEGAGAGQAHYLSPLPKGGNVQFPVPLQTPTEKAVIPRLFSWLRGLIGAKNPPNENLTIGSIPLESPRIAFTRYRENSRLHPIVQPFFEAKSCQSIKPDLSEVSKYCRTLERVSKTFQQQNIALEIKRTQEVDKIGGVLIINSQKENGKNVISVNRDPLLSEEDSDTFVAALLDLAFNAMNQEQFKNNPISSESLDLLISDYLKRAVLLPNREKWRRIRGSVPTPKEVKQFKAILSKFTALVPIPKGK
jgi:hypothetical protein